MVEGDVREIGNEGLDGLWEMESRNFYEYFLRRGLLFLLVLRLDSLMLEDFYGRFLRGSLRGEDREEGNGHEEIKFKERFPVDKSTRNVVANALYHTCCKFTIFPYLP